MSAVSAPVKGDSTAGLGMSKSFVSHGSYTADIQGNRKHRRKVGRHVAHCVLSPKEKEELAQRRRWERFRLKKTAAKILPAGNGPSKCGVRQMPGEGGAGKRPIEIRAKDGKAYYSGLLNCGSVWVCPVCSAKILHGRAVRIDEMLVAARAKGYTVLFVSLTTRHNAWDDLKELLPVMSSAFGKILTGTAWAGHVGKQLAERQAAGKSITIGKKAELGYRGMSRVLESTHRQANGWHPHVHAALFFDRKLTDKEVGLFQAWLYTKWSARVSKALDRTITEERGVDVRRWDTNEDLGWYVTKVGQGWSLGSEMASQNKEGYHGSRNVPQIFADYQRTKDYGDQRLLVEFYEATKGRKMHYTTPGLAEELGIVEEELTDEELANQEVGGDALVEIDVLLWDLVRRLDAEADLLTAAEDKGAIGVLKYLYAIGVPFQATASSREPPDGGEPVPMLVVDPAHYEALFGLSKLRLDAHAAEDRAINREFAIEEV